MKETSNRFELLEPTSPEALVPDSWVEPWMVALTVCVFLVILTLLIFRKKKAPKFDPQAARLAARAEAATALAGVQCQSPRDTAVQSSLILRKYLAAAASDPALFETHEEYLARHEALKNFSEESRKAAGLGFTRLAALKYAAEIPVADAREVIKDSQSLLETLHLGFQG
jgi:hypothetical protein